MSEVVLASSPLDASYMVVAVGTVRPVPPVVGTATGLPAASWFVVDVRVIPFAVS
ncbi:hypothetical protein OG244_34380 [Streptomyces brevispora]|uniref:hypothetical protein n=1 Tax=Streptomyces brevispora TaxID=887462 RepID=UPI002E31C225|nr:hypothetical protein [Streptomyces brevispora]